MEKKIMYIVKYYGGSYEDYYTAEIFVTDKKKTATKYVTKFNKILKKWTDYYSQFEDKRYGFAWISDKHPDKFMRWHSLQNITKCYYDEIEIR